MSKTALLLIDFQNDYFEGGSWPLVGTDAAAQHGAQLLEAFREKGLPVVHVRHEFPSDEAPFFKPGSEGAQTHASVAAQNGESVIVKQQINSFRDTNLKEVLDDLGVDSILIAGAMSHMCIDGATRAAHDFVRVTKALDDSITKLREIRTVSRGVDVETSLAAWNGTFPTASREQRQAMVEDLRGSLLKYRSSAKARGRPGPFGAVAKAHGDLVMALENPDSAKQIAELYASLARLKQAVEAIQQVITDEKGD